MEQALHGLEDKMPTQETIPPSVTEGQTAEIPLAASIASDVVQRKRGRHPKDCPCEKCTNRRAIASVQSGEPVPVPVQPLSPQERELAKQTLIAVTHTADTFAILYFRKQLTKEFSRTERDELLKAVPMSEPIRTGIVESGTTVAEKYGVAKALPEFALCSYLLAYVTTLTSLVKDLREIKLERIASQTDKDSSDGQERKR